MAVPKSKTSKGKRDRRRSHDSLRAPALSVCPEADCGAPKLPHRGSPAKRKSNHWKPLLFAFAVTAAMECNWQEHSSPTSLLPSETM